MIHPDRSLTLVTGFWLQRHELVRTATVYVRLFEELVTHVDGAMPIVCYIDPRIEADVRAIAARHPAARVTVKAMPFEELRFAEDHARFDDLQPANQSFTLRDTIEYAIIVWSKAATVARAIAEDPSPTSHYAWIDFGIAHVSELLDVSWPEIETVSVATDNLRFGERRATALKEVEDPWYFYSTNSARVCGGFITGARERWPELSALFDVEIARMIPTGTYALEEQVLAAASVLQIDTIDRWYADYYGLLSNAVTCRRDTELVVENLKTCRDTGLHDSGADIARYLLESGRAGLHLMPEQCLHLIDAGLVCALWSDEDVARMLASSVLSLYHYSRVGRGMMKGEWRKSIQRSLGELKLDFKDKPWTWEEFTTHPYFRVWLSCF